MAQRRATFGIGATVNGVGSIGAETPTMLTTPLIEWPAQLKGCNEWMAAVIVPLEKLTERYLQVSRIWRSMLSACLSVCDLCCDRM